MFAHENTIDNLRDEISSLDALGQKADTSLTRKENEKVSNHQFDYYEYDYYLIFLIDCITSRDRIT